VLLGPAAAFTASVTWAFATTRYSRASREVGSARVNLARSVVATAGFALLRLLQGGEQLFSELTIDAASWLLGSIVCSYALGDSLFLTASRRVGITTALSIASTYPLWAALWGTVVDHEPLGAARGAGMLLAVGGVTWLVQLGHADPMRSERRDWGGVVLSLVVSLLWALNSISLKRGSAGMNLLDVNVFRFGAAFVLLLPQIFLPSARALAGSPQGGWHSLLPALLVDCVLGSLSYVYGLAHTDLAVGATLSSLAPLISVPFAIAAGEERFDARRITAIAATVAGVALLVVRTC
jgi:drug/metabolite transporter (DMT)-like permease